MHHETESPSRLKHVTVFADGVAVPNPGAGGYGVVLRFGEHTKDLSGGFRGATDHRMELLAAVAGLEALKESCRVTLHSDSQYLADTVSSGAAIKWRHAGWTSGAQHGKRIKNADLWERLLSAQDRHEVELVLVKGHSGIADHQRACALAIAACQRSDLPSDEGYIEDKPTALARTTSAETKIVAEGQPCRKCGTPVVKRTPHRHPKRGQIYRFAWYLSCPKCRTMYLVEDAKQIVDSGDANSGDANVNPPAPRREQNGWLFES